MSYAKGTEHYNLPLTEDTDVRTWDDTNECFKTIDDAIFSAARTKELIKINNYNAIKFSACLKECYSVINNITDIATLSSLNLVFDGTSNVADYHLWSDTNNCIRVYNFSGIGWTKKLKNFQFHNAVGDTNYGGDKRVIFIEEMIISESNPCYYLTDYDAGGTTTFNDYTFTGSLYIVK